MPVESAMNIFQPKYDFQRIIRRYPMLFFPLLHLSRRQRNLDSNHIVSKKTELMIEGYFRSGNTFAIYAFKYAQQRDVVLACHTHAPASVIQAFRWNIPIAILIRNPVDTVASLILKTSGITIKQAIAGYIDFYRRIEPYSEHFLLVNFKEAITDFGDVVKRINQRFGTNFDLFIHNTKNVDEIFKEINRVDQMVNPYDLGKFSFPLKEREQLKIIARSRVLAQEYKPLLFRAQQIYQKYIS